MSETATEKPAVLDCKGNELALNVRVKVTTDHDESGAPKVGTVVGLEYQRQRAVVLLDTQEKPIVRPAAKLWVKKNKSGKVEVDAERAANGPRRGRPRKAVAAVVATAAAE